MNYQRIYSELINNAQIRNWTKKTATEYVELHHIIPKSLGGSNKKDNLVYLSAKEHFICHWLLYKFTIGIDKSKMANAWFRMCQTNEFQNRYYSRNYKSARTAFSENNPFKDSKIIDMVKNRMIENNPMKNPQTADKVSQALKGKFIGEKNPFYNQKHSIETLKKISGENHYSQREGYVRPLITEETRKKRSISLTGKKYPENIQRNKDMAATWEVTTPDGKKMIIKNINSWAEQQGIKAHWLYRSRNGYKAVKL